MDIFVTVLVFAALISAGGVTFMYYRITHPPPPPPISNYEKHKNRFIETGDPDDLLDMEKELEG